MSKEASEGRIHPEPMLALPEMKAPKAIPGRKGDISTFHELKAVSNPHGVAQIPHLTVMFGVHENSVSKHSPFPVIVELKNVTR